MLDAQTEKTIAQVAHEVRRLFDGELVCLALYGSAAGDDFVPGRSDINFAIVLEHLGLVHLKALHQHLPQWRKLGVATPLLLDRRFLERGRDVFPMEFHDIKGQHRVLFGEELFAALPIDSRHLRFQAEHEVRGKLLRLRALFAEVGADRKRLEALLLDSVKTFVIIMRNFIRVRAGESHTRYLDVIQHFETHFGVSLPTMRHLIGVKLGTDRWTKEIEATFSTYLGEVEQLVDLVDRMLPEPTEASHGGHR